MVFEGSFICEYEIDSDGECFGEEEDCWYVFGGGCFCIIEDWCWGFLVQCVFDEFYFCCYDFFEIDQDRGVLLLFDIWCLFSQIYVEYCLCNVFGMFIFVFYQLLWFQVDDEVLFDFLFVLEYCQVINVFDGWGWVNFGFSGMVFECEVGLDY